jgi:hypothetical protein
MGIRQLMDERPRIASGIAAAVVVAAIVAVIVEINANRRGYPTAVFLSYYSVDDGKTYFTDRADLIPPFDHNGQQAVRAYVYKCDGKPFVGYLERFGAEAHAAILSGKPVDNYLRFGREIKRPGDATWVKSGNLTIEGKVANITWPDGHTEADMVLP